jgi:peptidoglycan/xylan/chitin deacetylase (PgdA/CDA1 family)
LKSKIKALLSEILGARMTFQLSRALYLSRLFPYVHAVTYHDTPAGVGANLEKQLHWYKKNYVDCNLTDLKRLLRDGIWCHKKPGLVISFDDGLRSNFDVALPLLEKYGFTGWLMIPSGFVEGSVEVQADLAKTHLINFHPESRGERIALSWDEARDAERRGHVVACHSMNHTRLRDGLKLQELVVEIQSAKRLMETRLGHEVELFTWVGGEEWAYGRRSFKIIQEAGFNYIFCTNCAPITGNESPLFLQRYHIEPEYSITQLRFVLGGFYDLMYMRKRRRIAEKLR